MLRCVATITLFVPKHYTLTGHGRQTHGPFHTSCNPHRGHRLSWFSLSYTAWLEVAAHIAPLSRLLCVGAARHSIIQEEHSPSSFSSSQRTAISLLCRFFPSSLGNLCASPIKECHPVLRAFSSNYLTSSIVESELLYSLTAALTLVSLYSASIDSPWERKSLVPSGCFPPFSTMIFLDSLSSLCNSVIGHTCVHIK